MSEFHNPIEVLAVATRSLFSKVGEFVINGLDCFGDDPLEDQEIKSEIWNQGKE